MKIQSKSEKLATLVVDPAGDYYYSRVHPLDEYDEDIGRSVALSNGKNRRAPKWIMEFVNAERAKICQGVNLFDHVKRHEESSRRFVRILYGWPWTTHRTLTIQEPDPHLARMSVKFSRKYSQFPEFEKLGFHHRLNLLAIMRLLGFDIDASVAMSGNESLYELQDVIKPGMYVMCEYILETVVRYEFS